MEITILENAVTVFYITAKSFPEGIPHAHKSLHALVPFLKERKYFGISRPENGVIIYRAAAEEIQPGEAGKLNCESLVLEKGKYISLTINDYNQDLQNIERSFKKLLEYPGLDPAGYCVEWYLDDKEVKCMIRLET
ncbi:MAG: hypothetical protein WKI04_07550 [Ferruginibacter sp.]